MTTLDLLREIQDADSTIDASRARAATIQAALTDRGEFESAKSTHAATTEERRRAESQQRDLELEVETYRQQLVDAEQKLYGGTIRDARELQNLNRETAQIRGLIETREERLLQAIDDAEHAVAAHVASEEHLRSVTTERRQTEAQLREEHKGLVGTVAERQAERERLRDLIDATALKSYDGLRRRLGGVAVVPVKQRTCQGCRVSLIAAVEQRIRHGDVIVTCQSCGRILYPG